ncbi:MAG: helix-turn-helix transcriptional regulator [Cyanobacteria bacterium P01_F01_bin.13]
MDIDIFCDRFTLAMTQGGWTQQSLGKAAKVSQGAISQWLRKERSPSLVHVAQCAAVMNASLDWLCGLKDENPVDPLVEIREGLAKFDEGMKDLYKAAEGLGL